MADDTDDDLDRGAPALQEPMALTDDEVTMLTGRRAKAAPIVRRLSAHRRSARAGRYVSDQEAPPRLTAKEMAAVRRARRSTTLVRQRFPETAVPADAVTEARDGKARPDRSPPAGTWFALDVPNSPGGGGRHAGPDLPRLGVDELRNVPYRSDVNGVTTDVRRRTWIVDTSTRACRGDGPCWRYSSSRSGPSPASTPTTRRRPEPSTGAGGSRTPWAATPTATD